ncbi:uncharacterized protein LOC116416857 [Nasonia vitripennis]|uniref:Uncharacterized protein n=1 Tax=Nasonia vitripennis TaxID=7425 RepID=A0A7M7Q9E1_NASVI|nr:uncharacterized protein LOC116416857 [Nasonia vitripennis]
MYRIIVQHLRIQSKANVKQILDAALFTINTNLWLGHATIQFTQKKKPIIQTEQLHLACKLISEQYEYELPKGLANFNDHAVKKLLEIDFVIAQNLLILHVEIPLTDKTTYQIYKIDTVPVFIRNSSDAVLIKPVDDYIAIQKPGSFVHVFLSQHEISKCKKFHYTKLCSINTHLTNTPDCERTTNPSDWIYSASKKITGLFTCRGHQFLINFEGIGKLQMLAECAIAVRHQTYLGLTPARIETSLTIFSETGLLNIELPVMTSNVETKIIYINDPHCIYKNNLCNQSSYCTH